MAVVLLAWSLFLIGCNPKTPDSDSVADLILYNGYVYPVIGSPIEQGAVVIKDGKIVAIGPDTEILSTWKDKAKSMRDCQGAFVMPGFIEGHGHFKGLGENLLHLDLLTTHTWSEIVDSVALRAQRSRPGEWIIGRGWHQEKWTEAEARNVNGYPYHDALSQVSKDHPVMLFHASGHALMANQAAMNLAGISKETADPTGGRIVRDAAGTATGVFEENAMDLIWKPYQEYMGQRIKKKRIGTRPSAWHNPIAFLMASLRLRMQGLQMKTFADIGVWLSMIVLKSGYGRCFGSLMMNSRNTYPAILC